MTEGRGPLALEPVEWRRPQPEWDAPIERTHRKAVHENLPVLRVGAFRPLAFPVLTPSPLGVQPAVESDGEVEGFQGLPHCVGVSINVVETRCDRKGELHVIQPSGEMTREVGGYGGLVLWGAPAREEEVFSGFHALAEV